jgi:hypothetical protein
MKMTLDQIDRYEIDRDAVETIYCRMREKAARYGWVDAPTETWSDAVAAWKRRKEAQT